VIGWRVEPVAKPFLGQPAISGLWKLMNGF